jgi:nucleoside-diphosphate-sugar epimerase
VFGPPYPSVVDDDTWPVPALSYGAEKLACEVLLADYTRRGLLQGRVVRLPSIVARPRMRVGAASAFSSEIIRELARGESYVCPVSATATHWLMSLERCLDALLHAATLPASVFGPRLVVNLPPVHCTTDDLVRAVADRHGAGVLARVRYEPDPRLEAIFGAFPPMCTPRADAAGFAGDGTVAALVERAIAASVG